MMQIKFNVLAAYAVFAGGCDWPIQ